MAEIPQPILKLVEKFKEHQEVYKSSQYNEENLRVDFLNPFFKALGWDIENEAGVAQPYRDVVYEEFLRLGDWGGSAPDYTFRIGKERKFFVEAKKPSENLQSNKNHVYQLRRYGWSAKLPVSILTDFEEFVVYETASRPKEGETPTSNRVLYIRYDELEERWDEIYQLFSREAVINGSLEKFAKDRKLLRGKTTVDEEFLKEIEKWRSSLASDIARNNRKLSVKDLNYIVQKTIDRIIFLRVCEDRGIEPYGTLQALQNGSKVYERLLELFYRADTKYNSGLFHFRQARDEAETPDELSGSVFISDSVLKTIFNSLYYPVSPFVFEALPQEILGQVYEQFLGKVIKLDKDRAVVEEKPEVRKAGGVYYTPQYIIEYIVKQTVGRLVEGKTPKQVEKLKIVDPACGSGSFPLGAYTYLLDWHRDWYMQNDPRKYSKGKSPAVFQAGQDDWRLTLPEKKKILLNNIYGVDIDFQAVEVTKLTLLLKLLEGEKQTFFAEQGLLPSLGNNIKCGNSLIGTDFYTGQTGFLEGEEIEKVNPFDWEKEFPEVFSQGGFDAVIGNPPYIQLSMASYFNKSVSEYLLGRYRYANGRLNTFSIFIQKSINELLKEGGYFSFIVPNTILTQEYYEGIRLEMLRTRITNITNYLYPVFKGAVVETIVFTINKKIDPDNEIEIFTFPNLNDHPLSWKIKQNIYDSTHEHAFLVKVGPELLRLIKKIDSNKIILGSITNINQAIALKSDRSKSLFRERKADNYKRVIDGRDVNRYFIEWGGEYLAYDVRNIHSCKRTDIFETKEKIFFRRVGDKLIAALDDHKLYALNTLVVVTFKPGVHLDLKYILGLFNSTLINFYYINFLKSTKKIFSEIQARQIAQLPFPNIDLSDPEEKEIHDHIVRLVDQISSLHKKYANSTHEQDKTALDRQIEATDHEIDKIVYGLYGLSEEEIKIIEG